MGTPIKAIIFDLGGVLLDWDPRHLFRRYFPNDPRAMEDFLAEVDFYEWNAQQDKGRTFAEGIAELATQFPQYTHLIQAYFDHWEESVSEPIAGTVDVLHRLKQDGWPLFGLSNWSSETYPRILKKYPFFDQFDNILFSGDAKLAKPDPAFFNLLLIKTGYAAHECVLIDDSPINVSTAKQLGFLSIRFDSPEQLQTELQSFNLL